MGVVAEFAPPKAPQLRQTSSSLLANTPPPVIRALSVAYPLLSAADRVLGVLTWTSRDRFESVLVTVTWYLIIRYFQLLLMYFLPAAVALGVVLLADHERVPPSLDTIVETADRAGERFKLLVAPISTLALSNTDILRLVFATMFMSPLYILLAYFFLTPQTAILYGGLLVLTWHSLWFKVLRSVAWRFRLVRTLVFFATGIDRSPKKLNVQLTGPPQKDTGISFTYVVYENQRRWIGIGWTANMVPEERPAWTDPSLNETEAIETFQLPETDKVGVKWEWSDKQWLLDLSNGGMLGPEDPSRLKADPDENEGFVYYNNVWASPSATSGFSKYTRRRRWVRVASLVRSTDGDETGKSKSGQNGELRKRVSDSKFAESLQMPI